jgi:hypothetical protein
MAAIQGCCVSATTGIQNAAVFTRRIGVSLLSYQRNQHDTFGG